MMGRSEIGKRKKKKQIRQEDEGVGASNLEGKCMPCPDVVKTAKGGREGGIARCVML